MKTKAATLTEDLDSLTDDARALLVATADVAEEKVVEARKRLSDALDRGRAVWSRAQDHALEGVQVTDEFIRERPYQTVSLALAVGALLGVLFARRH